MKLINTFTQTSHKTSPFDYIQTLIELTESAKEWSEQNGYSDKSKYYLFPTVKVESESSDEHNIRFLLEVFEIESEEVNE